MVYSSVFIWLTVLNKISHSVISRLLRSGWQFNRGNITKKDKHRTATEWPRPGRLTQVTNIISQRLYERKVGIFENWALYSRWQRNTGPLCTRFDCNWYATMAFDWLFPSHNERQNLCYLHVTLIDISGSFWAFLYESCAANTRIKVTTVEILTDL